MTGVSLQWHSETSASDPNRSLISMSQPGDSRSSCSVPGQCTSSRAWGRFPPSCIPPAAPLSPRYASNLQRSHPRSASAHPPEMSGTDVRVFPKSVKVEASDSAVLPVCDTDRLSEASVLRAALHVEGFDLGRESTEKDGLIDGVGHQPLRSLGNVLNQRQTWSETSQLKQ